MTSSRIPYATEQGISKRVSGNLFRGTGNLIESNHSETAEPWIRSRSAIAVIGIDIGKNSFHAVGHDKRGAIMLRQKWSGGQVQCRRVAGTHHSRLSGCPMVALA
jgi:hypothetical protein